MFIFKIEVKEYRGHPYPDGAYGRPSTPNIGKYLELLQKLKDNGIEIVATLESWDLPDEFFQNGKEGWASDETVDRFVVFAKSCYTQFGRLVDRWLPITNIEKSIFLGYANHNYPPANLDNEYVYECF